MANQTKTLAEYAAGVRYADLPGAVVQRAKDCIADTIAVIAFGAALPWSRIVLRYASRTGAGGKSRVLAPGGALLRAPMAAFANGALAHAFEMDNLTWPNSGVHPGATTLAPAPGSCKKSGLTIDDSSTTTVSCQFTHDIGQRAWVGLSDRLVDADEQKGVTVRPRVVAAG